jgi:hypothetical protein
MKYIRQGLQFFRFLKRTTTLRSGTKLRLRSNSTNATSSSDLCLIYIVSLNNVEH